MGYMLDGSLSAPAHRSAAVALVTCLMAGGLVGGGAPPAFAATADLSSTCINGNAPAGGTLGQGTYDKKGETISLAINDIEPCKIPLYVHLVDPSSGTVAMGALKAITDPTSYLSMATFVDGLTPGAIYNAYLSDSPTELSLDQYKATTAFSSYRAGNGNLSGVALDGVDNLVVKSDVLIATANDPVGTPRAWGPSLDRPDARFDLIDVKTGAVVDSVLLKDSSNALAMAHNVTTPLTTYKWRFVSGDYTKESNEVTTYRTIVTTLPTITMVNGAIKLPITEGVTYEVIEPEASSNSFKVKATPDATHFLASHLTGNSGWAMKEGWVIEDTLKNNPLMWKSPEHFYDDVAYYTESFRITITPKDAIVVDKPGRENDTVKAPLDGGGVTYELTYDTATGAWSLTATAEPGYVFSDGTTERLTSGTLSGANLLATGGQEMVETSWTEVPASSVVELVDANGTSVELHRVDSAGAGAYTFKKLPEGAYTVKLLVMDPTTSALTLVEAIPVEVTKMAIPTPPASPAPSPTVKQVDPLPPIVVDKDGSKEDSVTAPVVEGVTYVVEYDQPKGTYKVTATPKAGYVFSDGKPARVWKGALSIAAEALKLQGELQEDGTVKLTWEAKENPELWRVKGSITLANSGDIAAFISRREGAARSYITGVITPGSTGEFTVVNGSTGAQSSVTVVVPFLEPPVTEDPVPEAPNPPQEVNTGVVADSVLQEDGSNLLASLLGVLGFMGLAGALVALKRRG